MAKKESHKTRSQQREEKRQQQVRKWMGGFIIAIMVLSSFAFVIVFYAPNDDTTQNIGGLDYVVQDNRLLVTIDNQQIPFYSFPDMTYPVAPEAVDLLSQAQVLIVAFDPADEENLQYAELVRWDLSNYLPLQPAASVLSETDTYRFPVGGCELATPQNPVLQIINGTPSVTVNDSCITLSGEQQSLIIMRDQLLYAYYGKR